MSDILRHFRSSAAENPDAPHAYANFAVVRDLSENLGISIDSVEFPLSESLKEKVRKAALELLEINTKKLIDAGSETIKGIVFQES